MTKISKVSSLEQVKKHLTAECYNKLFIGGQFVDPIDGQKMSTHYPATGEIFHELPKGNANDIESAIRAAEAAWSDGAWATMPASKRGDLVSRMAQGIEENIEVLAAIEAADVGKPFRQAKMVLGGAASEGKYWASLGAVLDAEQDTPVSSGGGVGGLPLLNGMLFIDVTQLVSLVLFQHGITH